MRPWLRTFDEIHFSKLCDFLLFSRQLGINTWYIQLIVDSERLAGCAERPRGITLSKALDRIAM